MSTIIIQLQGGLVQYVAIKGRGEAKEAIVIDEDTEGADGDRITTYIGEDGEEHQACIHPEKIYRLPKGCDMDRASITFKKG